VNHLIRRVMIWCWGFQAAHSALFIWNSWCHRDRDACRCTRTSVRKWTDIM